MSDLQILTGVSILISGYAQLRCGLPCYHWQVLVYLAWFSRLTHLSCLTALGNYLYNRPGERLWRLLFMRALVVMLLVAMAPTGNYNWDSTIGDSTAQPAPQPSDNAICYLRKAKNADKLTFASMIISMLLLSLGFVSRVVGVFRSLSLNVGKLLVNSSSKGSNKFIHGATSRDHRMD